jgi:hypothetical protein
MEKAYQHQDTAVTHLWNNGVFALIMEQGTGKSRPILDDWVARIDHGSAQDLLVIGPKGAYMNWIGTPEEPGEIDKWIPPEKREYIRAVPWITGGNKAIQDALKWLLNCQGPRFLCMNIEALSSPGKARQYLLKFFEGRKVIGVIDESTTIAHEDAKRTGFLLDEIAPLCIARRILTGLVAPESPMDLYSQYMFLDWRIIGQKTYWAFRNRYAITEQIDFRPMARRVAEHHKPYRKPTVVVAYRNLEELNEKIMKYSYRVLKKDVLDLPPKIYQFWDVELTDEQKRIYNQMKEQAFAKLADGVFSTAKLKLDQLGKMQHILCGHVRQEDQSLVDIPEKRTDAVVEILHNHADKAIIWAPYPQALRKIVHRLTEEFGDDSTVGFWGDHDLYERLDARARIQRDDTCRFIVSNQSVGKFGNTWTACNLVIYYANSFDNEDRQQSEDRPHRIGQTRSVTYIDLRARGTLDDRLIQVLRKKMNMAATLQGDEFRQWLI